MSRRSSWVSSTISMIGLRRLRTRSLFRKGLTGEHLLAVCLEQLGAAGRQRRAMWLSGRIRSSAGSPLSL